MSATPAPKNEAKGLPLRGNKAATIIRVCKHYAADPGKWDKLARGNHTGLRVCFKACSRWADIVAKRPGALRLLQLNNER